MRATIIIAIVVGLAARGSADPIKAFAAAKRLHADAQAREKPCKPADQACKAQAIPAFEAAASAYEEYVAKFANTGDALEARYYLADIRFFKLGKPESAGDSYMVVAKSRPVGKFHRDALVNAIAAYDAARSKQASPIDDKLRAAAELYATTFAGGPDAVSIIFKIAQLDFDRGKLDDAMRGFLVIVTKYPKAPEAGAAGDRALDIAVKQTDFQALWDLAGALAKHPAFGAKDQQARLAAIRYAASTKLGDVALDGKRYVEAAELYLRAAGEAQRPHEITQATMNAAVMFERARLPERAIEAYRVIAERAPSDPAAPQALFRRAHIEEAVWRWDRAAEAYEELAARYPAAAEAADALYNTAVLRAALGQRDRAIVALDRYTSKYRDRADVPQAALFAATLREESGDLAGAFTAYVAAFERTRDPRGLDALVGSGRVAVKLDRDQQATTQLAAAIALAKQSPDHKRALAEAMLWRARLAARKADRVSLAVAPGQLARAFASKVKLWAESDKLFAEVVVAEDPASAVVALRELAGSREALMQALPSLPAPAGLSAAEVAVYRQELQRFADAMRVQVIDLYRTAYARAIALKTVGSDVVAMRDALVRLNALPADPTARSGIRIERPPVIDFVIR